MMKKHGSNFTGKELMLFHGTSNVNVEKINAGGLNRSFAGQHGNICNSVLYILSLKYRCCIVVVLMIL